MYATLYCHIFVHTASHIWVCVCVYTIHTMAEPLSHITVYDVLACSSYILQWGKCVCSNWNTNSIFAIYPRFLLLLFCLLLTICIHVMFMLHSKYAQNDWIERGGIQQHKQQQQHSPIHPTYSRTYQLLYYTTQFVCFDELFFAQFRFALGLFIRLRTECGRHAYTLNTKPKIKC